MSLPWWWWPPALGLSVLVAAEIHLGAGGVRSWLPYVLLPPATAAALWWLGRVRVSVDGTELRVDDARLPVDVIADVVALDAAGKRELLGPAARPLAFVVQRPWIPGVVQVVLADPADPTPYWVVSSRAPDRLATALRTASPRLSRR